MIESDLPEVGPAALAPRDSMASIGMGDPIQAAIEAAETLRGAGGGNDHWAGAGDPRSEYAPIGEATPPLPPLRIVSAASLADTPITPRQWLVDGWIPGRNVSLLTGDGGTGKSLLALQLAVCVAGGKRWLRKPTARGRAIYLSCEDELAELHRRLHAVTGGDLADLDDLSLVPLAGEDAVMAAPGRGSVLQPTPVFAAFRKIVEAHAPALVVIDTLADVFSGDEILRAQARQFVSLLRGVALEFDTALLVLAHPSLSGLASGTGSSGSTAWANSVRSRLFFSRPKPIDGEPEDADARSLTRNKANYASVGETIDVRYWGGVFLPIDAFDGNEVEKIAAAERSFMTCLRRFTENGIAVTNTHSSTHAPSRFENQPETKGISKARLISAMESLLAKRALRVEAFGPPSKQRTKLVETMTYDENRA